ncbi:MAG: membrane protein of unknown function [Nitrosopumilales archaeon]|nr:MAG: membrane protein of unknown function [Nitrosopumilales archaeon]
MNKHQINNIIYDLNPKNCLSKFQNPSLRYAFFLAGISYGITILVSILTHDLPSVSFHKEALFEIPVTAFNTTVLIPILEEIFFFGIPISTTNNPIGIFVIGIIWPILHLFSPLNVESYSLSLNAFFATLPVLFFHFKVWKSGLGWVSIIFHCGYNTLIQSFRCGQYITTCSEFNENNFEFPEFYILLGITILSICIVYFLQRKKEEDEYIEKVLRDKSLKNN